LSRSTFHGTDIDLQAAVRFLVIEHGGRRVLHFNLTAHPTSEWVAQQLRETFSQADPYRYIIFDHDSKFNLDVIQLLKATGLQPKRTSIQAPCQNGIAERWIGSCRREMLNHIIILSGEGPTLLYRYGIIILSHMT
jgi:putative transposase